MKNKECINNKKSINYFFYGAVSFLLLSFIFMSFYTIDAGERGIVLTFGNPNMIPKSEGLHFKIPLIQKVIKMDVKTLKYEAELSAASRDLQTVTTKIAINYRISPESSPEIYKTIGTNYADKIIYPTEQEVNKATTSKFTAEELITKREIVREEMKGLLQEKLSSRNIIVEEVSIINFDFSKTFNDAIEAKVTAEQQALAAKNKLEQVRYEAEQTIARASAEAEALRLKKQLITPELVQLSQIEVQSKSLDVQREAISKWDGQMPNTLLSGSNSILPTLQIQQTTI
jgi:regulator of protease activity HflC (stomatin/prohibitin superfamily)